MKTLPMKLHIIYPCLLLMASSYPDLNAWPHNHEIICIEHRVLTGILHSCSDQLERTRAWTTSRPLSFPIWQMWRLCTYPISRWDIQVLKLAVFQTLDSPVCLWLVRMGIDCGQDPQQNNQQWTGLQSLQVASLQTSIAIVEAFFLLIESLWSFI